MVWVGFQQNIPLYFSVFDIYVLPSYWEGFANSLIQAAAMGIPVITTTGTGCRDAVKNDYNGIVVPVKNEKKLYDAMEFYLEKPDLMITHGQNGLVWAKNFIQKDIWKGIDNLYNEK